MPLYDATENRVIVRIVYDGPPEAGKTTNVLAMRDYFTLRRRGEFISPGTAEGERTRFFDWMHLEGGLVNGIPVRCHLLTVPGQTARRGRREFLLELADVVVFVADCSPEGIEHSAELLVDLAEWSRSRSPEVPVIVQGNKQDLEGAEDPEAFVRRAVPGWDPPVVAASAAESAGVRETATVAMRAAADLAQRQILAGGVSSLDQEVMEWEELRDLVGQIHESGTEAIPPPTEEGPQATEPSFASTTSECAPTEVEATPPAGRPASRPDPEADEPADPATTILDTADDDGDRDVRIPPLPSHDVDSSSIWPASVGRKVLADLAGAEIRVHDELVNQRGRAAGSGSVDALILEIGEWCFKTSGRRCFGSHDAARAALVRLARQKVLLGQLVPSPTVLAIGSPAEGGAGSHWLWTITPWMATIRTRLEAASRAKDAAGVLDALELYAALAVRAIALAWRENVVMDVHPSNFGIVDGEPCYLDDDINQGRTIPAIGWALLKRFDEYGEQAGVVDGYLAGLSSSLEELDRDELFGCGLLEGVKEYIPMSAPGHEGRERLMRLVLNRSRGAV